MSDPDGALALLRPGLAALAKKYGLKLEPGRYVLEVRAGGADKGHALRELLADFDAGVVVVGGDDLGDLAAYDAVDELRAAGRAAGLLICSGADEVPAALAERADLVLDGPAGVARWLSVLADALEPT
jgi:trehalose 6-phosphate phosphatase